VDADADVVIAGAGCAGLTAAVHLVRERRGSLRILLIEPRARFERDRTWCAWNVTPHAFEGAVSHRWPRWRVRAGGQAVVRSAPGLVYQHIPADAFYERALEELGRAHDVVVRLGERVESLSEVDGAVTVRTDQRTLRARVVLDGRPPTLPSTAPPPHARVLQHFHGYHVRVERPSFDPECVELMDFDDVAPPGDPPDGPVFVYALPFAADEALVEATWFTPALVSPARYDEAIRSWLRARHGIERFETLRVERGVIPMTTEPFDPRPSPRVHRIGTAAGWAKPSTGYAFHAIQRAAPELARRLARSADLVVTAPRIRSRRAELMDHALVSFLIRHPAEAPALFLRLFDEVPPASLVRFLSDAASATDVLRVIAASPPLRMMTAFARATLAR